MKNSATKNKNSETSRRPSLKRRPWLIVAVLIVLAAALVAVYFLCFHSGTNSGDTAADSAALEANPAAKGASAEKSSGSSPLDDLKSDKTPTQYDGDDPNTLSEITGYVSYAAVNDDHLSVRLTINQFLTSGTCDLTLSQGSTSRSYSSPTVNNPSYASCEGFDVPLSDLGSGHWDISVKVTGDDKQGTITGGADL